jgi:2-methylcitrate dehydratase PrpD
VRTRSGDTYEVMVEQARGSIEKPLSNAELEAKVYELASERLPHADIAQLLDRLWRLDEMATIDPLMALVSVPD